MEENILSQLLRRFALLKDITVSLVTSETWKEHQNNNINNRGCAIIVTMGYMIENCVHWRLIIYSGRINNRAMGFLARF